MSYDILTPFSNAACQTFRLLLDLEVLTDPAKPLEKLIENEDNVDIVIGITGDLSGEILYRFPKTTTLEIVRMMSGMEFKEIDEFVKSALGEIANIISGNAMTDLSEQKVTCDILPPKFIEDKWLLASGDSLPVFYTKVKTPIGDVELNCKIKQS